MCCLATGFDAETSLLFIEKWLLPTINACPENLGNNINNAARILEGLPSDEPTIPGDDKDHSDTAGTQKPITNGANHYWDVHCCITIRVAGRLWLRPAANQFRCTCE